MTKDEALREIANMSGLTLLGCCSHDGSHDYPHCCSDEIKRAHQIGANKAFEQAASIAETALADSPNTGEGKTGFERNCKKCGEEYGGIGFPLCPKCFQLQILDSPNTPDTEGEK